MENTFDLPAEFKNVPGLQAHLMTTADDKGKLISVGVKYADKHGTWLEQTFPVKGSGVKAQAVIDGKVAEFLRGVLAENGGAPAPDADDQEGPDDED